MNFNRRCQQVQQARGYRKEQQHRKEQQLSMIITVLAIALFTLFFTLGQRAIIDQRAAMPLGGLAFLVLGSAMEFYPLKQALESVWYETLALIFGMSLVSATLARSGLFDLWAYRISCHGRGAGWPITVLLILLTYGASLLVNNLTTMVVLLPVTIRLCQRLAINPVPIVIAEIISANLGGASTMMGDFPNMIITSAGNLHFTDFTSGMMAPCLVLLATLLFYLQRLQGRKRYLFASVQLGQAGLGISQDASNDPVAVVDPFLLRLGGSVLLLVLVGFLLAEPLQLRPGVIALAAGMFLLLFVRYSWDQLPEAMGLGDILFFMGLFVMVGGLKAAGVLEPIAQVIDTMGSDSKALELLLLMWMAWAVTPFLNARPATAFFIPVAQEINAWIPGDVVWWALSLGILAGSSAALTGATSGPIAASHLENHRQRHPEETRWIQPSQGLDFAEYLRWGLPISLIFLGLSSLYILLIAP